MELYVYIKWCLSYSVVQHGVRVWNPYYKSCRHLSDGNVTTDPIRTRSGKAIGTWTNKTNLDPSLAVDIYGIIDTDDRSSRLAAVKVSLIRIGFRFPLLVGKLNSKWRIPLIFSYNVLTRQLAELSKHGNIQCGMHLLYQLRGGARIGTCRQGEL